MRVIVTGGGTGGHIIPALAIAKALLAQGDDVLYIGNEGSMESTRAPEAGVRFAGISFSGMPRKAGPDFFRWVKDLLMATRDAGKLLRDFKPDVLIGTGGYVSAPVLLAAWLGGKPYVIHEPDAYPGLANRLLAKGASNVTATFEECRSALGLPNNSPKFHVTGNPIRPGFGELSQADAFKALNLNWDTTRTTLLVFGGSQGAQKINLALAEALPTLVNTLGLQVLHISGEKRFDETKAALPDGFAEHPFYRLMAYSDKMPELLAACDLAVCRAGSLTLSELYASGTPAVLVPYPHAAADHQSKNALAAQGAGTAVVLPDADCTAQRLTHVITDLFANPQGLARMAEKARGQARPDATDRILGVLKAASHKD